MLANLLDNRVNKSKVSNEDNHGHESLSNWESTLHSEIQLDSSKLVKDFVLGKTFAGGYVHN